jgi:3-methyladenine DNA glycosylase/8-oxoguanine DNA glycosylase
MALKSETDALADVLRATGAYRAPRGRTPRGASAQADPKAREFLRRADPIRRRLIDARPDFRPRAWLEELPPLDAFATLIFQVVGQQLSVSAPRTIVSRLQERPDVLLSGDLALRRAVERAYGFDHLPTEDEMVQLAERRRPYRSLAVSYLFASEFEKGT